MNEREYKNWIGDHLQAGDQAALEKACDAYSDLQEQHGLPRLSEGESCAFEAGWEAGTEYARKTQAERERIAEFLNAVFESSTHGASGLMQRAIKAVESNDMGDPTRIAKGWTQDSRTET